MFECMVEMLIGLIETIPYLIGLFLSFNFIGDLLFNRSRI